MYQGPDDKSCAFAPAIEAYDEDMERQPASVLLDEFNENLYAWAQDCDHGFASAIQRCHDRNAAPDNGCESPGYDESPGSTFVERFQHAARELAEQHDLVYPS